MLWSLNTKNKQINFRLHIRLYTKSSFSLLTISLFNVLRLIVVVVVKKIPTSKLNILCSNIAPCKEQIFVWRDCVIILIHIDLAKDCDKCIDIVFSELLTLEVSDFDDWDDILHIDPIEVVAFVSLVWVSDSINPIVVQIIDKDIKLLGEDEMLIY